MKGETNKSRIKDEIIKCGRDPVYFIKKYVRIKHPQRGLIPFKMWDFQEELVHSYQENRFNVVLKARQLGATEITSAFCAWLLLFYKNKNILCVATKAETAKNIIRRVRTVIQHLPSWLVITEELANNKMSLEFDNGSVIKAIASSADAGRSEAVSLLVVDEAAFIAGFDEIWTGLLPTVTAGGRVIMISTPNGVGNVYHKTYKDAESGQNDFKPTSLMWWRHPEHIADLSDDPERPGFKTSPWFRKETQNMSARDRAQEHECDFLSSGDTFVPAEGLALVESTVVQPVFIEYWDRNLHVWSRPKLNQPYFISADVARGDGRDNQGFHCFETDTMLHVVEYYGKIPVNEYAKLLCDTGWAYGKAPIIVENNSYGLAVIEHMRLWTPSDNPTAMPGYPNLYCSRRGDASAGECMDLRHGAVPDTLIPGLTTSAKSRPVMLSKMEEYIRMRQVTMRSMRFLGELRTFVWNEGRPEALRGYNDDLVMSCAMGIYIRDCYLAPNVHVGEIHKALLTSATVNRVLNTDIRGASKDPRLAPARAMGAFVRPSNPYKVLIGRHVVDLSELLDKK